MLIPARTRKHKRAGTTSWPSGSARLRVGTCFSNGTQAVFWPTWHGYNALNCRPARKSYSSQMLTSVRKRERILIFSGGKSSKSRLSAHSDEGGQCFRLIADTIPMIADGRSRRREQGVMAPD